MVKNKLLLIKSGVIFFALELAIFGSFKAEGEGADWKYLGKSSVYFHYYDTKSIVKYGTTVRVWTKDLFRDYEPKDVIREVLILKEVDCKDITVRSIEIHFFLSDGKLKEVTKDKAPDLGFEKSFIIPQTADYRLYEEVCK